MMIARRTFPELCSIEANLRKEGTQSFRDIVCVEANDGAETLRESK